MVLIIVAVITSIIEPNFLQLSNIKNITRWTGMYGMITIGVSFVIITGGIDKFAINTTKGGFGGIGGSYTKAEAKINLRLIDTTTAERVIAVSANGNVKKGGGFAKGASLSRED